MDLAQRLTRLSPEKRKLFELKLTTQSIDILQLPISKKKRAINQHFPLSFGQERLWFIQQLDPGNTAYNLIRVTKIEGKLDTIALEKSINEIIRRHDILRTLFIFEQEKPAQIILDKLLLPLGIIDLKALPPEQQEIEVKQAIQAESQYHFDLTKGPLLRTKLLELNEDEHVFLLVIHHIISDGTSVQLFIMELVQLYRAFFRGHKSPLSELPIQYVDYTCWQQYWFGEGAVDNAFRKKQETYWLNEFHGEIPILTLPYDYPRPVIQSFEGNTIMFGVEVEKARKLKEMALKEKTTLYIVLLAIYNIFLAKLSGTEDIIVGTPLAGRRHPQVKNIIGMFVNTLVLRNYPHADKTFLDFLSEVKERTLNAFENQEYRYEDIVGKVNVSRDTGRNPLFDVMFLLKNVGYAKVNIPGLNLTICEYERKTSMFDLTLSAWEMESEQGDTLHFSFEYCSRLFKQDIIERFIGYFKQVLHRVVKDPKIRILGLEITPGEEKRKILYMFNDTRADYPRNKTIYQLFVEQAEKNPDHLAVVAHRTESAVSYRELNRRAEQLDRLLREKGIKPDDIVGIMVNRSLEMMLGLFGILKSGGAYLPIDPAYPAERKCYIFRDSNAELLLTTYDLFKGDEKLRSLGAEPVFLEESFELTTHHSPLSTRSLQPTKDIAYVIYTSGSTGNPKGVMIEHLSLVNRLNWMQKAYPLGKQDVVLQKTTILFDVSVWELFWWSIAGASLCLLEREGEKSPEVMMEAIKDYKVTTIHFVPSMLNIFLEFLEENSDTRALASLRRVFASGEVLMPHHVERFTKLLYENNGTELINLYGPTEATVDVSYYNCISEEKFEHIPIGKPIANINLYIMNRDLHLQPVGVVGELSISGVGLARGYLNRPELAAERFIDNPYPTSPSPEQLSTINYQLSIDRDFKISSFQHSIIMGKKQSRAKLYCTGDLARWLPDGNIEFLGRVDHQVKIRGFRIELGEIENQLLNYDPIKDCVVTASADETGDKYLCAYIVSDRELEISTLRDYLAEVLPDYMIPYYFVFIEKVPLTFSGKIDFKALPPLKLKAGEGYVAPRTDVEEKLADIWAEVLGIEKDIIGINSNFFEIGGHSLKATLMVTRIHKHLNVKLSLAELFKAPTIRRLSENIKRLKKDKYTTLDLVEEKEYYELSSSQKRLYVLQQMDLRSSVYNIPLAVRLIGKLDNGMLEKSFQKLIGRHGSLRTSFNMLEGKAVQKVHHQVGFEIKYYDMVETKDQRSETRSTQHSNLTPGDIIERFNRPFDLSQAPLLRVGVIKMEEENHLLLVDMHHTISDGVSQDIFIKDLIAFYNGEELSEIRLQYKDFSEWQIRLREEESEEIKRQRDFWLERFKGEIPVLDLPIDFVRPAVQNFAGSAVSFEFGRHESDTLRETAIQEGATLYMLLLSITNILLAKIAAQEDIVIGTVAAGRWHPDLEQVIGTFVNTLALRNCPAGNKTFRDFLKEVKDNTLNAFENQRYPYEDLVDKVVVKRDTTRNPLFDVMFAWQNIDVTRRETSGLKVELYEYEEGISKFDLALNIVAKGQHLFPKFEYKTGLFKRVTIERFIIYFKEIVSAIVKDPARKLWQIEIIPEEEKKQLLYDFNSTAVEYPRDKTIHQLFSEQVERTPDHIAVAAQRLVHRAAGTEELHTPGSRVQALSYRELNKKSDQLAYLLMEKSLQPGTVVGIMLEPSLWMIIGLLGILKAGGAYLPIDPGYPGERKQYMLTDSNAEMLISSAGLLQYSASAGRQGVVSYEPVAGCQSAATFLAYIIYTSGSTGRPKGVMVEHRNVVRLVKNSNFMVFCEGWRLLMTGSLVFDVTTFEIWGSLLNGLSLYLVERDVILDNERLRDAVVKNEISVLHLIPQLFNQLLHQYPEMFAGLKYFLVGGDLVNPGPINRLRNGCKHLKIIHAYGPTENTTFSTSFCVDRDYQERLPIGRPIANSSVYILDKYSKLQPTGVLGELYTGGDGVARGYLNNPELTAEKFIISPAFGPLHQAVNRLYRTGDFARWLSAGIIDFLGRIDYQVKIRGYRIEPGEIERQLTKLENIKEALVVDRESGGEKYLCAYVVSKGNEKLAAVELKSALSKNLPQYMIPSYFVQIEKIPLSPNGKVDRKALPEPGVKAGTSYVAPRDDLERGLVNIWCELLGLEKKNIGIDCNFFDLGGHSLKATLLTARIHKEFNVKIPLAEIFRKTTIRELVKYIKSLTADRFLALEIAEKKECYELSSAQKRLYVLQQMKLDSSGYNVHQAVVLEAELDRQRLEEAFRRLIERHESFRTSFEMTEQGPVQRIYDPANIEFEIEYYEIFKNNLFFQFVRPFDLACAPLLRVGLIKIGEESHILMVDIHHIITDGTSVGILIKELIKLYCGEKMSEIRLQYKDFSEWQNRLLTSEEIKRQAEYWREQFEGDIPVLDLPTDYPRPVEQTFAGGSMSFEISLAEIRILKSFVSEEGVTLFILLLALFNIFLSKICNQGDILIGIPIAGRRHADLEQIIGMFVNTLVIRSSPVGEKTIKEFLNDVKNSTLDAFENQEYQFEELIEQISVNRDISRNPLFDVIFTLHNETDPELIKELKIPGLKLKPYEYKESIARFDLELIAVEADQSLSFKFLYCSKLFKKETVVRFINYFKRIVYFIVDNPEAKILEIDIMSVEEKQIILFNFNNTVVEYPRDKRIHELFEEQVERIPDHIAIVGVDPSGRPPAGGESMDSPFSQVFITYIELNTRADQLAQSLKEKGVGPNHITAIMMERSIELIVGILGILKSGAAYLPIDPLYPVERIRYLLFDSAANLLITRSGLFMNAERMRVRENMDSELRKFKIVQGPLSKSETIQNILHSNDQSDTSHRLLSNCLAYIIYTSGTTGKPKGVMIEHRNVVRLVKHSNFIDFTADDKLLLTGTIVFDITTFEIWAPLLNGINLYLVDQTAILDGEKLEKYLWKNKISILHLIPQLFNQLADQHPEIFGRLKYFLVGGDLVQSHYVNRIRNIYKDLIILHMYGPTENTTFSTYLPLENDCEASIPIGKPIANSRVYIVAGQDHLQPVGVAGELCLAGDGVGRGYLNNPELTYDKFSLAWSATSLGRLYRTGDLARWLPDGNIEFLGRIDHQVKIRGIRIELGEIESQLLKHHEVKEAVVLARKDGKGEKYLCAYIVKKARMQEGFRAQNFPREEFREFLSHNLPDYMIPLYFLWIDEIPLTTNGKIDRKALPEPRADGESAVYSAPGSELEEKLVEIWSEVLGVKKDNLGIDDDFFKSGGHSLNASIVVSKIRKEFDVDMPLVELFKTPTIKALAEYIWIREGGTKKFTAKADNLALLKAGIDRDKHLFFIHDGTGEVDGYIEFCKYLSSDMHYWGVRADRLENLAPRNQTIEEMARKYIEKMKSVQAKGPYYIAGWSYGGIIAFEMVEQLEQQGECIGFLGLIDSPPPHMELRERAAKFNIESELNFIEHYSIGIEIKKRLKKVNELSQLWPWVVDYLETNHYDVEPIKKAIAEYGIQALPNYHQLNIRESIYYLSVGRTFRHAQVNYTPKASVHTLVYYFAATQSTEIIKERWNHWCCQPVKFYEVSGDHFSILKVPQVEHFAKLFDNVMKNLAAKIRSRTNE